VTVQLVERMHAGKVTEPYKIMEDIIKRERADLKDVKIGIAWRKGWRSDADGVLPLGRCKKRGDLDRELDDYDFILLLNAEAFPKMNAANKRRLIYHELEHAQLSLDTNGDPKRDDRGRLVTRIRKHDIEDFRSVVAAFGWEDNLSELAKAAIADAERPLLAGMDGEGAASGAGAEEKAA
jgi:hypothetical protein